MMIRTNLYPPELAHRRVKRPGVLIAFIAAGVLTAGTGGWQAMRWHVQKLHMDSVQLQVKQETLQKEVIKTRAAAEELTAKAVRREAVLGFAKKRVNWAPILEKTLAAIPENVELQGLQARCLKQEECTIEFTGRSAADRPRLECDKLRLILADALSELGSVGARLSKLEDSEAQIRIDNTTLPCADFSIELKWRNRADE